ncbi:MAG: hypothetical protein HFF10_13285 [Angelakisella sp.]|nr:hypothetical protein [Angelakisella sp.]
MNDTAYQQALIRVVGRYKRRQVLHFVVLALYAAVILGRPLWAWVRAQKGLGQRAIPLLLLALVFLLPPFLFYCWYIWKYHQAIARLAAGNLLEVTGEITEQKGRRYTLRETLPKGLRQSSFQHLTRNHAFLLPGYSREMEFRVGEIITVYYPGSRILWQGAPETVWIFSPEEGHQWENKVELPGEHP